MTTLLQQRVRQSGNMAPSLWNEDANDPNDGFEDAVTKVLDGSNGACVARDVRYLEDFAACYFLWRSPFMATVQSRLLCKHCCRVLSFSFVFMSILPLPYFLVLFYRFEGLSLRPDMSASTADDFAVLLKVGRRLRDRF
jgi:hypothetical protein